MNILYPASKPLVTGPAEVRISVYDKIPDGKDNRWAWAGSFAHGWGKLDKLCRDSSAGVSLKSRFHITNTGLKSIDLMEGEFYIKG
jgi:hypothetical protein